MKGMKGMMGSSKGQSVTEYALILALIAVAVIVSFTICGASIQTIFSDISTEFTAAI